LSPSFAGDLPFTYPSNRGGTGLMEIPTARIMRENSYRIGFTYNDPYNIYYGALSPLKRLEIDGQVTSFSNTTFEEQSSTKDKAVGLKYQFHSEGKYLPAIALGIVDPHGTKIFSTQYVVASKQMYPFDFTLGFGNGRFGSKPILNAQTESVKVELLSDPKKWLDDSQFFWGIQFAPSDRFAMMLEYSPVRFHKQTADPVQPIFFTKPVPSKFNYGIRFKPVRWMEMDLSYQRGEQVGFSISTAFDIGNPLVPIYDRIYAEDSFDRKDPFTINLTRAIHNSGFSSVGVAVHGSDLWIEAQNDTYFYSTRAIGVILNILSGSDLDEISAVHIILKENEIPVMKFTTTGIDIGELFQEKMNVAEFMYISRLDTSVQSTPDIPDRYKKSITYGITPNLQMYLNSREGFFKYRFGLSGWGEYQPWKGGSFIAGVQWYPVNTVPVEGLEESSRPVRSDLSLYLNSDLALERLMFDQITKLSPDMYGRFSAGLLEIQYSGIDGEIASPVLNGRVLVGVSGSAVKKRLHDSAFQLQEDNVKDIYTTVFLNGRLNIPEIESAVDLKAGRFLAGDNGVRVTLSKFIKGVTLKAWYSFSDTSIFNDDINSGYHDKGISVSIPLRLFKGSDSRTLYSYSVSPWTRDTQQDVEHVNSLFDFMGRNVTIYLDKDRKFIH
ncbi:MAG: YjbH domain-containing protein, partial [Nitrospiraceae bacterium]